MPERLLVLVGPTAVGKTETAIRLAETLGAEIISADSRTFYRGMDIGTAKPTPAERARAPHHLVDVADPGSPWSLTVFQAAAREAAAAITRRGRLPVLVGGAGQYIRAVTEGWTPPGADPDPRLRIALERWAETVTPRGLHTRLRVLDPAAAEKIDYRNVRRTVRALEVIFTTGRPFSIHRKSAPSIYNTLTIGLIRPRAELYARIDARIDAMLAAGWLEETAALLARGLDPALPALTAIGYAELAAHLRGEITLDAAAALIRRRTRTFVRRQANWFKLDDPGIRWFQARPGVEAEILPVVKAWLAQTAAGG